MRQIFRSCVAALVLAGTAGLSAAYAKCVPTTGSAPVWQQRWEALGAPMMDSNNVMTAWNRRLFYNYGDDGSHDSASGGPSGGIN